MGLLLGHDESVAAWVTAQTGMQFRPPFVAFGVVVCGRLCGAVIWNDYYHGGNIEITVVGRGCWQQQFIRKCFRYAFVDCKCSRITARTRRSNVIARRVLPRLGFAFEGTQKRYFGPERSDDGLVFVMLRENAGGWLNG